MIFRYGTAETAYLSAADPVLGQAIDRIGPIERTVIPDFFAALVNSIAGQQISSKALETVWTRILAAVAPLTPENLLAAGEEWLRACGLSGRKVGYMQAAALAIVDGTLDIHSLVDKTDQAVIDALIALPGVGRWTAEMLMIFCLQRPDVLAFDDLGIRRGLCALYGWQTLTRAQFEEFRVRVSPYGTVAALYLWEIARL